MKNVEALKLFHFLLFSFFLFFFFFFLILSKLIVLQNLPNNEVVCIAMNLTSAFCVALSLFFFFFFFLASCSKGQQLLFMNSSHTCPTFSSLLSHQWIHSTVHGPINITFQQFFHQNWVLQHYSHI